LLFFVTFVLFSATDYMKISGCTSKWGCKNFNIRRKFWKD